MAINFIGALNAVQKIYADKTNLMVPVGCGEDTPPTPPTPTGPIISNVVVTQQAEDAYLIMADSSMDIRENYVVQIQCEGMSYPVELDGFEDGIHLYAMLFREVIPFVDGGTWTTAITNQTTMEYEPEQTGTYTFIEIPKPIVSNVVVTQVVPQDPEELAEYTITADCNMDPYPNFVVKIKCECMELEQEMMYRNDHLESGYGDYDSITHFVNGGTWTAYIFDLENSSQTTQTGTYTYIPLT